MIKLYKEHSYEVHTSSGQDFFLFHKSRKSQSTGGVYNPCKYDGPPLAVPHVPVQKPSVTDPLQLLNWDLSDTVNFQSFVCQHYMTLYLPFQQTLFIQVAVGRNHSADCWVVELRHPRHHLSMASRHEPYGSVCWWRLFSSVVPIRYDVFIYSHRKYLLMKMLAVKKGPAQKICICKKTTKCCSLPETAGQCNETGK